MAENENDILEPVKQAIQDFIDSYKQYGATESAALALKKTFLSKNITIEDWNTIINIIQQVLQANTEMQDGLEDVVEAIEQCLEDMVEKIDDIDEGLTELQEDLDSKQDTISDLSTIRTNAQRGATAVQPSDLENILEDYAKTEDLEDKEDKSNKKNTMTDSTTDYPTTHIVKEFVNSSITTNTATFRGTSATGLTEAQFLAWANTLTKTPNDYVFWNTTDSNGNVVFKRYKYTGTEWLYEYTLNNSSFTQAQWTNINTAVSGTVENNKWKTLTIGEETHDIGGSGGTGDVPVEDVKIGTQTIVDPTTKVATIPTANSSGDLGVVKQGYGVAIGVYGNINTDKATDSEIDAKVNQYKPIVPYNLVYATKVGMLGNTNLTEQEKSTIKNNLGVGATWGSITGTLANQTDLSNELTNIREVAEGKCKSFILSYAETIAKVKSGITESNRKAYLWNKYTETWDEITQDVLDGDYDSIGINNSKFNSQSNSIQMTSNSYLIFNHLNNEQSPVFTNDTNYYFYQTFSDYTLLRQGDIVLVIETDVPDRWFGGEDYYYKLETSKIDLTSYVDIGSAQTITGVKTFANGIKIANTSVPTVEIEMTNQYYTGRIRMSGYAFQLDTENAYTKNLKPLNSTCDLGDYNTSNDTWRDLYLTGKISDRTHEVRVSQIAKKQTLTTTALTSISLNANAETKLTSAVSTLTISALLNTESLDLPNWSVNFKTASSGAISITLPAGIKFATGEPIYDNDTEYLITIRKGYSSGEYIAVVMEI